MRRHIMNQLRTDGILYFALHFRACMEHCRNQKRLYDLMHDAIRQQNIAAYVDALYAAGDL